jgi:predicted small metal-binding protein
MSVSSEGLRYDCLEPDCGWSVTASGEDDVVERVTAHMAEAHSTFELEDVVLANCVVVDDADDAET